MAGRADPARSARIDADDQRAFAELGVSVAVDDHAETEADDVAVWSINWRTVEAFLACATCWREVATMTRMIRTGLVYADVDAMMRRRGFDDVDFSDLQVMESAALGAFAEVAD